MGQGGPTPKGGDSGDVNGSQTPGTRPRSPGTDSATAGEEVNGHGKLLGGIVDTGQVRSSLARTTSLGPRAVGDRHHGGGEGRVRADPGSGSADCIPQEEAEQGEGGPVSVAENIEGRDPPTPCVGGDDDEFEEVAELEDGDSFYEADGERPDDELFYLDYETVGTKGQNVSEGVTRGG